MIDTLEKSEYVRRERDQADRRVVWLVLTDAGRERSHQIAREAGRLFRPTEAEIDPVKEKIVREFLVDLIVRNHERSE